jgi:hypothetical protein
VAWGKYRKGVQTIVALPPDMKSQLIRNKLMGHGNIGEQVIEALKYKWGNLPIPAPAVVANPAPLLTGRYAGMRQQVVHKPGDPKIAEWNL